MMTRLSLPLRAVLAGAVCLSILSGVLVLHAWPLWTGQSALLPVTPIDPRDMFGGEYVRLDTPATRLAVRADGQAPPGAVVVAPVGAWWWSTRPTDRVERSRQVGSRVVYVQLEPRGPGGESQPVSISSEPLAGRVNLRGWITSYDEDLDVIVVDYGLDRFFVQQGSAKAVEDAVRERRRVQMEIAVARSGHARIRRLLVDGEPAGVVGAQRK